MIFTGTPNTLKAKVKALKIAIGDYNMWPPTNSENHSAPLTIATQKSPITADEYLKLDAALRRRYHADIQTEKYKVPTDRLAAYYTVQEKLWPLVVSQADMLVSSWKSMSGEESWEYMQNLQKQAEADNNTQIQEEYKDYVRRQEFAANEMLYQTEILEYLLQVYCEFLSTSKSQVVEVRSKTEPDLIGFFIAGETESQGTVYARTLLVSPIIG